MRAAIRFIVTLAVALLGLSAFAVPSFYVETVQPGIEPGQGSPSGAQNARFRIVKVGSENSGTVYVKFGFSGFWGGSSTTAEYLVDFNLSANGLSIDSQGEATVAFNLMNPALNIDVIPFYDISCENAESVSVTLHGGTGYNLSAPLSASTTIANTNIRAHSVHPGGIIQGNGMENGNTIYRLELKRSCGNGVNSGDYPASFALTGTAENGSDYTVSGSALIQNGSSNTFIYIHFQDDTIQEGTEYINVAASSGGPTLFAIPIGDNESCVPAPPTVVGKWGHHVVRLSWNAIPNAESYKVKRAQYVNGTLSDYTEIANVTWPLSWDDGTAENEVTYSYVVTTIGGTCGTPRESVPSAAVEKTPHATFATLSVVPGTLVEGGPSVAIVRATLNPPVEADTQMNVAWDFNNSTASWINDFGQSGNMIIPGGQSSVDLTLIPKEDTQQEPTESISYRLDWGYYNMANSAPARTVTVWLYDNDPGEAPVHTVTAGNNQVLVTWPQHPGANSYTLTRTQGGTTVTLLNNAPNSTLSFLDDTAVNGTSYTYILYATTSGGTRQGASLAATPENTLAATGAFTGTTSLVITITGASLNKPVSVEASDDMVNWTFLSQNVSVTQTPNTATASGSFLENSLGSKNVRYYRFRSGASVTGASAATSPTILTFQRITLPAGSGTGSGGFALAAIQLQVPNMRLAYYFPGLPVGTKATFWNENSQAYDSTFTLTSSGWYQNGVPNNPILNLGTAVFLQNPTTSPVTIIVVGSFAASGGTVTSIPAGYSMRSALAPKATSLPALGLVPPDGTTLFVFNKATQAYNSYFYDSIFGGWSPVPYVEPGDGLFFSTGTPFQWVQQLPTSSLSLSMDSGGLTKVKLTGPWFQTEQIQSSVDLVTWSNWQAVNSGARQVETTISDVATVPARFFRVNGSGRRSAKAAGYYKVWVPPQTGGGYGGWVLAANQLNSPAVGSAAANTLQSVLPSVSAGLKASKWNPTTQVWDTYTNPSGNQWQLGGVNANTSFAPGETMFFQNPGYSGFYLVFFGEVPEGNLSVAWPAGSSYRAGILPQEVDVGLSDSFPRAGGLTIQLYNSSTQSYQSHMFDDWDWNWSPSAPVLKRGEGFAVTTSPSALTWNRSFVPWP
jgi:hypothetical protein